MEEDALSGIAAESLFETAHARPLCGLQQRRVGSVSFLCGRTVGRETLRIHSLAAPDAPIRQAGPTKRHVTPAPCLRCLCPRPFWPF